VTAVVQVARESALVEAAEADRAIASGGSAGPLLGVPITVKEAFRVAGLHSTWGLPDNRDFVAERDATVVRRLRRAGVIVVGTTNVATLLGDFGQSANEIYGATNNPWDIVGPLYEDDTAITFAELLADLVGGFQPPPL
jgi:amidase